ncbi:delta-class carbonic anhydrase [Colwellia sp. 20A7]|uniref:delta-class carbonic anhydrase n=1 Tax=Colwellia sp. 20A7 TaxID=2689569 RepID=UPI001356FD10|nr:delta-class carbonic anhydrase [Colwellia sp. 20A7]
MKKNILTLTLLTMTASLSLSATASDDAVSDEIIAAQRAALETNTDGKGFGPQSPRDIDLVAGENLIAFDTAPLPEEMNLCNIHFHENAEHKGGEFTEYAGNGDGHGYNSGYKYTGTLTEAELSATTEDICPNSHGYLKPGSTIEVHYVHSTAQVDPGPTLGACLSDSISNPQLRVETQVYVLVNDENALDFANLTAHDKAAGKNQVLNIPSDTGTSIQYSGSTTGPGYNEDGSPLQVSWSVRPQVAKVNIESVGDWCKGNVYEEDHAHGVRNLVQNQKLLSTIK